jgi:hypothetical protein
MIEMTSPPSGTGSYKAHELLRCRHPWASRFLKALQPAKRTIRFAPVQRAEARVRCTDFATKEPA